MKRQRKLSLSMLLAVVFVLAFALCAFGAEAVWQGAAQTTYLGVENGDMYPGMTVLHQPTGSAWLCQEGTKYYLNRANNVYDISGDKNFKICVGYGSGMNAYSPEAWKDNGMRYLYVMDENFNIIANWRDETPRCGRQKLFG